MPTNEDKQQASNSRVEAPTISIYQNGDYVSGILQQVYGQPLLTDASNQQGSGAAESTDQGGGGNAGAKASGGLPGIGNIEVKIGADYNKRRGANTTTSTSATQNWRYTQAYYLYAARAALRESGAVREITCSDDAAELLPGDLVEYKATFSPSQLIAILDIVTPEIVSAIARKMAHSRGMNNFQGGTTEIVQAFKLKLDSDVQAAGEMAFAATAAAKVDFRSEATREFYGHIGSGEKSIKAVTICDLAHFIVEDEDRILDGEFKVLGKVTSKVQHDVPILGRNKVLDRLNPESVDELVEMLNEHVPDSPEELARKASDEGGEVDQDESAGAKFDFSLDSRVSGPSFNVIPIAIYI